MRFFSPEEWNWSGTAVPVGKTYSRTGAVQSMYGQ